MAFTYTKRADGRLVKKVTIQGKSKPVYLYSNNKDDLESQYIKLKYADLKGLSVDTCSFKDYSEKWIILNSSGKAEATVQEYKYIVNKYLIPRFGYMKLSKIKRLDIQELQSELIEKEHVELAHKCIRFMKTILDDAIINDFLNKNPCAGIKEPKIIHKERLPLTAEQDKLLLNSHHKYAPFFRILRYTGMRREEISALTISDVDLKNKTISINKALSFAHNKGVLKPTKNKKSRVVPVLDIIYPELKDRIEYCKKNNISYLFTQQKNESSMLSQESIRCMVTQMRKNLNFNIGCHQLRHSYCTMLYYSGITLKETQKLMGHSSAKMVYDIYTHLDEQKEDTSNKLNNYLRSCQ